MVIQLIEIHNFAILNLSLHFSFLVLLQQTSSYSCVSWSLLSHLQAKIKFNGPITVAEYMKEVLTNPKSVSLNVWLQGFRPFLCFQLTTSLSAFSLSRQKAHSPAITRYHSL